jgi:hypothetical protein
MKVTLDIAGGLAAPLMSRQHVVDSARLEESQQKALAELIDAAVAEPQREPGRSARDARSYEIRVATGPGEETIVAYDGSMGPMTRKLIEMIKSLAQS